MNCSIKEAVDRIKTGEIVAFPTETVYGLGADAFNPEAVAKIFALKGRPADNPLIVHIDRFEALKPLVNAIPEAAEKLARAFWPGPLAIILLKNSRIPDIVTAGLNKVAVRCPNHPLALDLIRQTGPLAAPSANKSGRPSPTSAAHVELDFGIDFPVLDGGMCDVGIESTVLDLTTEVPIVFRPGAISAEMIESVLGKPVSVFSNSERLEIVPSPGLKYTHYAPKAAVQFWDGHPDERALILSLKKPVSNPHDMYYAGDINRLARELYDKFRLADFLGLHAVKIERFEASEAPVAAGLLNRIQKAIGR